MTKSPKAAATLSAILLLLGFLQGTAFASAQSPVAAIFKLIGRDALRVRRREKAESHWLPKTTPSDVRDYFRQF